VSGVYRARRRIRLGMVGQSESWDEEEWMQYVSPKCCYTKGCFASIEHYLQETPLCPR
jgi:hypothetical protein